MSKLYILDKEEKDNSLHMVHEYGAERKCLPMQVNWYNFHAIDHKSAIKSVQDKFQRWEIKACLKCMK